MKNYLYPYLLPAHMIDFYKVGKYSFFLLFLLCFSCNNNIEKQFTQVRAVTEEHPDSAIVLLEAIDKSDLNEAQTAEYNLLFTQARSKNNENIINDTLIFKSAAYFEKVKDIGNAARANFYAGKVVLLQEDYKMAILYLLRAEEYAQQVKNWNLLGLICSDMGYLYCKELNLVQARKYYDWSQNYFRLAGNEKNEKYMNNRIAYLFLLTEEQQPDSALFYFQQAFDYAKVQNDSLKMSDICKNIGVLYIETRNFQLAKEYVWKAIKMDASDKYVINNYTLLSNIYVYNNEPDSAIYYIDHMISPQNTNSVPYKQPTYYYLMYRINKEIGNHKLALKNHELMSDLAEKIFQDNLDNSVSEIKVKYLAEKTQNANNKMLIYRLLLFIVILLALAGCSFFIWLYISTVKRKDRDVMEAEENLEVMKRMLSEVGKQKEEELLRGQQFEQEALQRSNTLRPYLVRQLDVARKVAQIEMMPNRKNEREFLKRYNEVFKDDLKGLLKWDNLKPIFDDLYAGYIDKLQQSYPNLTEKDIQLCCLIHAGLPLDEISFFMSYTYDYIRVYKVKLWKKMGFDSSKKFMNYLDEK